MDFPWLVFSRIRTESKKARILSYNVQWKLSDQEILKQSVIFYTGMFHFLVSLWIRKYRKLSVWKKDKGKNKTYFS